MATHRKNFKSTYIIAIIFILGVTAGAYYIAYERVLDRSERSVESLILSQRGLHHYIHNVMHPTYFKALANGDISKTYYAPEILSSSFVVRTMHSFYNQELVKHGLHEIYYKLAAENPRNPVNKADQLELDLDKEI
jgi:hypothetical protein